MFFIEGNIGTGKTTLLKKLASELKNINIVLEAVENWTNKKQNNENLLANFYSNIHRYAFTMELTTLTNRINNHFFKTDLFSSINLIERSIYSSFYCFARNSYETNFLQNIEWTIYKEWFDFFTKNLRKPFGFIYLQAAPEISFQRTLKRNRTEEKQIELDYLKKIHKKHEEVFIDKNNIEKIVDVPVLIIDSNENFIDDKIILKKIENFILKNFERNK